MTHNAHVKRIARTFCLSALLTALLISVSWQNAPAESVDDVFETLQITKYAERQDASDFTLPLIDGEKKSLSDYKGSVVLLNFWTTW